MTRYYDSWAEPVAMAKLRKFSVKQLKAELRAGPYSGGYPKYFITDCGQAMSFDSVKENYRLVLDSVKHGNNDGWRVVDVDINWEDDHLICCHSGEIIESAYGESTT